jgi:hypothetical protein
MIPVVVLALALCGGLARPSAAELVDLELVMAVDISGSVDFEEATLQRNGYVKALTDPQVVRAIKAGKIGRIAATYIEWAGDHYQATVVDWAVIDGPDSAADFARRLADATIHTQMWTSISGAIEYGITKFKQSPHRGRRRVIDISGDGPNNHGRPVLDARAEVLARGIIVNGLPLMTREGLGSMWHLEDLDQYYRHCVIGGPGAFVVPVLKWSNFPEAVRRKLVLELAGGPAPRPPEARVIRAQADGYDCLVGEKMWMKFRRDWIP